MFFSFSSLFSPLFVAWNFPSVVSWGLLESSRVTVPLEQARFSFGISQEKVSLPTDNPTLSFWTHGENNANPLATEGSEGPLSDDIDIAIIGSGITGVSLAYHLSQSLQLLNSPLKIAVLEARNFCEYILVDQHRRHHQFFSFQRFWCNWFVFQLQPSTLVFINELKSRTKRWTSSTYCLSRVSPK